MSLYVKEAGKWLELGGGAAGALPGLGGWANVTAVTGNPTKHAYKDAAGVDWVAYEWTADGSLTCTAGLVNALLIGGGGSAPGPNKFGNSGNASEGTVGLPAGTATVTIGTAGTNLNGLGGVTSIGPHRALGGDNVSSVDATGVQVFPGRGSGSSGNGASGYDAAYTSSITGTAVAYGLGSSTATPNPGQRGSGNTNVSTATPGVAIVRVPAEHAKA